MTGLSTYVSTYVYDGVNHGTVASSRHWEGVDGKTAFMYVDLLHIVLLAGWSCGLLLHITWGQSVSKPALNMLCPGINVKQYILLCLPGREDGEQGRQQPVAAAVACKLACLPTGRPPRDLGSSLLMPQMLPADLYPAGRCFLIRISIGRYCLFFAHL